MTNRERMLAILEGKPPDRIPWVPRLQLWYNARQSEGNMPERYRGLSLREIERRLGMGTPARAGKVFNIRLVGVEKHETVKGGEVCTEYRTPIGCVTEVRTRSDPLAPYVESGLLLECPIKRAEDYPVMEYVVEHTYYEPAYEAYLAYEWEVGEDGYPQVGVGDCPFHHFLLNLVGYNSAYFHLVDYLPQVEHLLSVMEGVEMERLWPVVLESPARLLRHGQHFDSQMTPPHLFARYIKSYYQKISPALHARGKVLAYHADDDSQAILSLIKESGFDMADCLATAPMVTLTLQEARRAWGSNVIVYGGVPSVLLEESAISDEEFESYMANVFRTVAPGDAFILGVSDNVMPRSQIERVELVSRLVEEWGRYPVSVP